MLEINNIWKSYEEFSLEDIHLKVDRGSYTVVLGPSGAGKTQLLEVTAGLIKPDRGTILLDGKEITHLNAQDRPIGIVFQDLAVFPHLNAKSNIAYALHNMKLSARERNRVILDVSEKLGIRHLLNRRPDTLSGGELQRIALARTLVRKPRYLLLDEPLASLDVKLRQDLYSLLKKIHREGQSILHVTHDFEEAMVLATDVAVMNKGRIIQSGRAREVFQKPGSEFVARFTGIKNYFEARLESVDGVHCAQLPGGQRIKLLTDEADGEGFVMVPAEEIILSLYRFESSAVNQWKGKVTEIFDASRGFEVKVDAGLPLYVTISRESLDYLELEIGKEVWVSFKASGVRFVKA